MSEINVKFIDNAAIKGCEEKYETILVDLQAVLNSWKISLFSFEWLTPDGDVRKPDDLPEQEQEKYHIIMRSLEAGDALERPVLGVGVMDNVEIGSRRDVLLTVYAKGIQSMEVHVLKSNIDDLKIYKSKE